jgi:hypothetical protein
MLRRPARRADVPKMRTLRTLLLLLATGLLLFASVDADPGTVKVKDEIEVNDEETAGPDRRTEPHVDCEDFWVEGFNMGAQNGTLDFYSWPPTGDMEHLDTVDWDGELEEDGQGYHFLAGPFQLDPGHYRVEAWQTDGNGGAKSKMFWVDPCEEECPPEDEPCVPPEELACPTDLAVASQEGTSVTLSFTPAEGSDGTNIYRAIDDGDFVYIATVGPDETEYTDGPLAVGPVYTYTVSALYGDEESATCGEVEATAIPDFPTVLGLGAATIAGAAAYLAFRRK